MPTLSPVEPAPKAQAPAGAHPVSVPPRDPEEGGGGMNTVALVSGVALLMALTALMLIFIRSDVPARSVAPAVPMAMGAGTATAANDAVIDPGASPAPSWKAFDATLQPAEGGTVHNASFHMTDQVMEVAPGVTQMVWTFNGQVPGPTLRGHVGDVFNVTVTNDSDMPHSIDFHASQTAMNVNMKVLAKGQSLVYSFKAEYSGIFMYHCGAPPALQHIGNGMYGAVVVDPPGLAPVTHEYVMVQSEFYLGPKGGPGDYAKMQAATPDAVVFNGYYAQYKFAPLKVGVHDRIRIWVLDAGPSENSSFHVVGTIFDTVYKEGSYTLRAGSGGGSQTLDLQPAQGGFVELTIPEAGNYAIVTHKFANVGRGAVGTIVAGATPAMAG
jgi:nitrite reductase (NO-forming)